MKKTSDKIKILFIIRVCLWIVAFVSTVYWIYYSFKLHLDGVFEYHTYATMLRPVLYPCLLISVSAVCLSFALYAVSKRWKK